MLVDCGEGTQIQLRKYGISFLQIEHIFISHLHGDHYFGIFGLLTSMNMLGRKKALHLYAPPELHKILNSIWRLTATALLFEVKFHPLNSPDFVLLVETRYLMVYSFPLEHSKANWGFKFCEKQFPPKIKKEAIEMYKPGIAEIHEIKQGNDLVLFDGTIIPNEELVFDSPQPRTYTYCSDTLYIKNLHDRVGEVDVLYHEATFASDAEALAKATFHATASQAAMVAKCTNAKALIIGHYSTRYPSVEFLRHEALQVFQPVFLAEEGTCFIIDQQTRLLSISNDEDKKKP